MKFGRVENPQDIDFTLPRDHQENSRIINQNKGEQPFKIHVGCAKWNKADLKNFYPKGTKDELHYYSRQFNSIELNATFYRIFPPEQFQKWYDKTPKHFRFFPKIYQDISHRKRLNEESQNILNRYLESVIHLKEKLGGLFLQMHTNFSPKDFNRVIHFIENWPKEIPLATEFRHTNWFNDKTVATELYQLLEENNISNTIVDSAGRRDIMHMRLTNNVAFIRYVSANHRSDYKRLEDWVERIRSWKSKGIREVDFFVHQNTEIESASLATYLIKRLNSELNLDLDFPGKNEPKDLFSM